MIRALFGRRHVCEVCGVTCGRFKVCDCEVRQALLAAAVSVTASCFLAAPLLARDADGLPVVTADQMMFSLPVLLTCIGSSIVLTWTVCSWTLGMVRRMHELEQRRSSERRAQTQLLESIQREQANVREELRRRAGGSEAGR